MDLPDPGIELGSPALHQGMFPTQGSNWCLLSLTCVGWWIIYHKRHLGSLWGVNYFSSAVLCTSGPFGRGAAWIDFSRSLHCLSVSQPESGGNLEAGEPQAPSLRAQLQGHCLQTLISFFSTANDHLSLKQISTTTKNFPQN